MTGRVLTGYRHEIQWMPRKGAPRSSWLLVLGGVLAVLCALGAGI